MILVIIGLCNIIKKKKLWIPAFAGMTREDPATTGKNTGMTEKQDWAIYGCLDSPVSMSSGLTRGSENDKRRSGDDRKRHGNDSTGISVKTTRKVCS